ncbi:hypothetical protein C173_04706 [Paenibacillus sp. FSL R7-277]|uniref:hypothetical protein n=1 Tax=Paenibacillus sp. FSL R7-277 TaxID=1227352 RepID=UPI0003E270A6|nr:hypothetical protein [Paenibacillus sp. FSL R7-277]ETT77111.1 hypothetical protein C173_04706 [Paenibacillus sp. FSL R7-277]
MSRRTRILLGITIILLLAAAGFIIGYDSSKMKYELFREHRAQFEAVKAETRLLMDNLDERSNIGNTFIYSNNRNTTSPFHDSVNTELQDKIRQIAAWSGDSLDFVRYSKQDGKPLLRFIFDWEREHGATYHIVYCGSQSMMEQAYATEPVKYKLTPLADGWYGIEIE